MKSNTFHLNDTNIYTSFADESTTNRTILLSLLFFVRHIFQGSKYRKKIPLLLVFFGSFYGTQVKVFHFIAISLLKQTLPFIYFSNYHFVLLNFLHYLHICSNKFRIGMRKLRFLSIFYCIINSINKDAKLLSDQIQTIDSQCHFTEVELQKKNFEVHKLNYQLYRCISTAEICEIFLNSPMCESFHWFNITSLIAKIGIKNWK